MPPTRTGELTSTAPVNWSNLLDQVIREYETPPAKGLAHGLQKDALQNGWGARHGRKKFKFEFLLLEPDGSDSILAMTDSGTVGLIGDIYSYDDKTLPDMIPSDQRLARFECMFDSGGDNGPGLFGRGKLLFNAASVPRLIYYDSLTKTGVYRFGMRRIEGRKCQQFRRVREGAIAEKELEAATNGLLQPLAQPGTRIIIASPRSEIVEAIKSGSFLKAIEETWWEIISKHDAEIALQIGNNPLLAARIPLEFGSLPEDNRSKRGWRVYYQENLKVAIGREKYRVKRLHLLVPPADHNMRPDLLGVNVHRKGMKIGELRLSGVPQEIEDRFFGYVQLEPDFEQLLAELENVTHYGFASLHKAPYRNLKRAVQDHFDLFMEQLGLRKPGADPEQQTRRLLEDAQAELNSILHDLGVPALGSGLVPRAALLVSVEDLEFPDGSNYVQIGDRIAGFWYRVENTSNNPTSVWLEVYTYERDVGVIETLQSRVRIDIPAKETRQTQPFSINLVSSHYPKYKKVRCVCKITDGEKRELAKKAFFFYIDLEPEEEEKLAQIRLLSIDWPRAHSRRVDYGEAIKDLHYEVESLSPVKMKLRVRLRTLWAAETNAPIADVETWDVQLSPFQSQAVRVAELPVTQEVYQEVDRGKVNVRCHATATEKSRLWEKGQRLAQHTVSFFLNTDPSYGFFETPENFEGGPDGLRSEARPIAGTGSWKFRLNINHPAYLATESKEDRRKDYSFEEMAKQTVYVLVRTDQFEVLRKQVSLEGVKGLEDLAHEEVLEKVAFLFTDRILASYYAG